MSTPEISSTSTIKSKYTPLCAGGINKSLLTPCRQIGLSRKRKTSFNKSVRSSENVSTNIQSSCINDFSNKTTPVSYNKISIRKRKNLCLNFQTTNQELSVDSNLKNKIEENGVLQKSCDIQLCKKELFQSFTSEDFCDTNDPLWLVKDEIAEDNKKVLPEVIDNIHQISNIELIEKETNYMEQNTSNHKSYNKSTKRRVSDFINSENICTKNEQLYSQTSVSDSSDDDFVISKSSKIKQRNTEMKSKRTKRTCTKQSLDCSRDSFQSDRAKDANSVKQCKIQLQKLSEEEIKTNNFIDNSISNKKCNSSCTEDGDFFTSTPEQEMMKRKNLEKEMTILENQIKQKQSILENLKRASIYKSKHNIPELKQLTSLWLDGCVQALKDLLVHLQAHGPINLTTLLNNMQIPKEIVAKLQL